MTTTNDDATLHLATDMNWDAPLITELSHEDIRKFYTPKKWRQFVEKYCPELNPEEQYQLRYDEDKKKFQDYLAGRIKACAMKTIEMIENAATGGTHAKIMRCGCHGCLTCGPYQEAKLFNDIKEGIEGKKVKLVRVEDRAKLTRKYGKDKVRSFPVELDSGKVVYDLLIETEDDIGRPYDELQKEDVHRWSKQVYNHNKSGNLFQVGNNTPPKEKKEENVFDPTVEAITQNQLADFKQCNVTNKTSFTNIGWAELATDLAILETIDLMPNTQKQLDEALLLRREARTRWIEKLGGVIFDVDYRKTLLVESDLDWSQEANRVEARRKELEKWFDNAT